VAPISQIWWGDSGENILDFQYAFFDRIGDREPRPGSAWERAGDGEEIAWLEGRDYVVSGQVRHISQVGGPVGWQAFLDWAGEKRDFRLVPDRDVPDFFVPDCRLIRPLTPPRFSIGEDHKRQTSLAIRNPTVDFEQAYRGIMFEYAPGASLTDPVAATFARGSGAYRTGVDKKDATELANVLRDRHYIGGQRTTLLEAARTPVNTPDPEDFSTANWGRIFCTVTHPFRTVGALNLDKVNDDQAGGFGRVDSTAAFQFITGGTNAWQVVVRYDSSVRVQVELIDQTTLVRHGRVDLVFNADGTLSSTAPAEGATSGNCTLLDVEPLEDGKTFRLWIQALAIVQANSYKVRLFATAESGGAAADLGAALFGGVQVENAVFPSSYNANAARNGDSFRWAHRHVPQAMFILADFIERGTFFNVVDGGASPRVVQIGSAANDNKSRLHILAPAGGTTYRVLHTNDANANVFAELTHGHAIGDRVQLLGVFYPDGSVQIKKVVNGGAETAGTQSGALAWDATFDATGSADGLPELYINSRNATIGRGFNAHARIKVGVLTHGGVTRDTIAKAYSA